MINGNNSYAQSIGTNMQNPEGVFLKEPVPAPDLIEKSITDNGDYSAKADGADGYSSVDVNVANSFTPADEGKVVSDGALIAQTAYPTEITENDTYDTTDYNSITVNVSGGGGNATFATATEFNYVNDYLSLLTNIDIPDGVESIGDSAFSYCVSLTSITIPNSVTTIESSVFMSCSSLTSITFEPTTPPTLSVGLGIPTTCIIRVPQGTLSAYTSAENYPDPSEYSYEEY